MSVGSRFGKLMAALLLACSLQPVAASWASAPVLPVEGALLGAYVAPRDGQDRRAAWTSFEEDAGRPMSIDRQYYVWDAQWPTADDEWSRDAGRTLLISWNSRRSDGNYTSWASIAAGQHDRTIDARAEDLIAFGDPIVFAFHHEPEGDPAGTADEFVAAFRHVRARFEAAGVPNVTYAWILGASSFGTPAADSYYPGDDAVDVVAADGYNWFGCPGNPGAGWRSFEDIFAPFHYFGAAHGKPMIVAEWGAHEDPDQPYRKARWIQEAATQLALWPDVKGAVYFHNDRGCPRWIDSSAPSLDAFRDIGTDPWLSPPPVIRITAGPPTQTVATDAAFTFFTEAVVNGLRCKLDEGPTIPCDAGTAYTGLTSRPHRFEVWGVDEAEQAVTAVARWSWTVNLPGAVVVADHAFDPKVRYSSFGSQVSFSFWGPSAHSVTDETGLGLFDSGLQGPGGTLEVTVASAGTFAYGCTAHPKMDGQIKAGVTVSPGAGATETTFIISWAAAAPAPGFAYDVQIKRPASRRWKPFRNDTLSPSVPFNPTSGPGVYSFRARLVSLAGGASGWSGARSITVT